MVNGAFLSKAYLRTLLFVLLLGCLILSAFLLLTGKPAVDVKWRFDSLALLAVLACQVGGIFLSRRASLSLALISIGLILVIVIGLPLGGRIEIKLALWSTLFLEAAVALEPPLTLICQAVCLVVIMFFQGRISAWGQLVRGPEVVELIAATFFLAVLALVLHALRLFSAITTSQEGQLERLDEAVGRLTSANLSFQNLASTAQERSAEDERKRITREIHDAIGYALTNLIMTMEACMRLAPREATTLRQLLARAREEAQVGLNETRKALRVLRGWSPAKARGLLAVQQLVNLFSEATGVTVKTEYCNADMSSGEEKDIVIYRMIQEGLTNAFRHGHASLIKVKFWQEKDGITVTLWDNGIAGESYKEGIGLQGMRERVERIGGTLRVYRTVDGFELSTWLPLEGGTGERTVVYGQDFPALGG
jgi:signal transduction histidine kinase